MKRMRSNTLMMILAVVAMMAFGCRSTSTTTKTSSDNIPSSSDERDRFRQRLFGFEHLSLRGAQLGFGFRR